MQEEIKTTVQCTASKQEFSRRESGNMKNRNDIYPMNTHRLKITVSATLPSMFNDVNNNEDNIATFFYGFFFILF